MLEHLGYSEITGSGSRRKFIHKNNKHIIHFHEPHPKPILKVHDK
ncbi:type II toxin-antitoxin system HicA family toxin [Ohtaekwangia sp.]